MIKLSELIDEYNSTFDPEIKGITQDSRQVKKGWLFTAVKGTREDGRRFIYDAITHGAVAILTCEETKITGNTEGVAIVRVPNPRRTLSLMAARFYNRQPGFIAAVTGTNGKTSSVHFAQQIWHAMDLHAACIGTLGVRRQGSIRSGSMTTPDPVSLHAELADLAAVGITHLALEASSHGLDQYRLDGMDIKAAGFASFSQDHLDYHKDMETYLNSKIRLFTEILDPHGVAVLNADIPEIEKLATAARAKNIRTLTYGREGQDIKLLNLKALPQGQKLSLRVNGKEHEITLPLIGPFQALNALCALGLVIAEDPDNNERNTKAVETLKALKGVPGRLELVSGHPRGAVYVDYAHTPDALRAVLEALRPHTENRLICIIGCGGDRDPSKRTSMGHIAATLADLAIITDDNPRTEDPAQIRARMMQNAPGAQEIGDRRKAIQTGINELKEGDVLVIAGKGHEQGQVIGETAHPFDDVKEALTAIESL